MAILRKIIRVNDARLMDAFGTLFNFINEIEETEDADIEIDFSLTQFVTPFFLLPLMVYLKSTGKRISISNPTSYIGTVCFGEGVIPENLDTSLSTYLSRYIGKTFIPIVSFPTTMSDVKDGILSAVEDAISRQLNIDRNIIYGIKYLISEAVDNISEHSESERGYIFYQYYPQKHYMDICIADNGISILGSYMKMADNEITTDLEAIRQANRGVSTKNLPDAENRGYGIITSKKMLVQGLGGHYFMLSGNAFHINDSRTDKYVGLPPHIRWQGTIIALRIPYNTNESFNSSSYYE